MATYYVWNAATGTGDGLSWANAYSSLQVALLSVSGAGDTVLVAHDHTQTTSGTVTIQSFLSIRVICVNRTTGELAETALVAATGSPGSINVQALEGHVYGITFRTGTGTSAVLNIGAYAAPTALTLEKCKLEALSTNSNAAGLLAFGSSSASFTPGTTRLVNCTLKVANGTGANTLHVLGANLHIIGGLWAPTSATPTNGISVTKGAKVVVEGFAAQAASYLVVGSSSSFSSVQFVRCELPASVPVYYPTAQVEVLVSDCSSDGTLGMFGYYNLYGSVVSDTGVYVTAGAAGRSWKITTSSSTVIGTPFITPYLDWYDEGTSAITPYFEVLQTGSATPLTEGQAWAEFAVKEDAGMARSSHYSDRMLLSNVGTAADQAAGAGAGIWTGAGGTNWSGKLDSGAAVTPAVAGHIRGRVFVGKPSATLYIDPVVRT